LITSVRVSAMISRRTRLSMETGSHTGAGVAAGDAFRPAATSAGDM
jgi:hypothetical protein